MFIRPIHVVKNGKRHAYWALVESYRSVRGPRQRTVAYLGQFDQAGGLGVQQAATGHEHQRQLFDDVEPRWVQVDLKRMRVERCLEFGGPWLPTRSMTTGCIERWITWCLTGRPWRFISRGGWASCLLWSMT